MKGFTFIGCDFVQMRCPTETADPLSYLALLTTKQGRLLSLHAGARQHLHGEHIICRIWAIQNMATEAGAWVKPIEKVGTVSKKEHSGRSQQTMPR